MYENCLLYLDKILILCARLMKYEDLPNELMEGEGRIINFIGVKKRILDIIQVLVKNHQKEFPLKYKDQLWEIIEYLCYCKADPSESRNKETDLDPYTLSLNSVRGSALHVLIDYALWYAFQNKDKFEDKTSPNRFQGEERIQNLLETKLDKNLDKSLAIHSIFGVFLPNLAYLSFDWLKSNIDKIFPLRDEQEDYWKTAWGGLYQCFKIL